MMPSAAGTPSLAPGARVGAVMREVIYALIPAVAVGVWWFGWGVVVNLVLAAATALAAEALMLAVRGRPVWLFLGDASALVTALLLAFAIPPLAPWWLIVFGTAFAIIAAKHLYGGLGFNPFNPAMVGYVLLLVSFPREMSTWPAAIGPGVASSPLGIQDVLSLVFSGHAGAGVTVDAVSSATPLDAVRTGVGLGHAVDAVRAGGAFGHIGGKGTEWVNLAVLGGGLWLLARRIIGWQIPLALLATLAGLSGLFHLSDPARYADPLFHLSTGASLLGAFFIATDPVSAATTPRGRLFYGAGIGAITYVIRTWGGYPDGIAFAVLLMNLAAPTIDQYTRPRLFGERSGG
ncbi:MAG: RnfABCDGE type electron transport complex subunit D [Gammaproteobacteria bacterium]